MRLSSVQRRVLTALATLGDRIVSAPARGNGTGRIYRLQGETGTVPLQTINALCAAGYLVAFDHTITPAGRRALEG